MAGKQKPDDLDALIDKMSNAVSINKNTDKNPTTNIDIVNKITDVLFDMKSRAKRKMLGILDKQQIQGIKRLDLLNQIVFDGKNVLIQSVIDNEIYFSVAEKGKGREQLVDLTKVQDENEAQTGFRKYL